MSTEENLSQIKGFDRVQALYNKNRKNILIAGIILIIGATGLYYYSNVMLPQTEETAQAELFRAQKYFEQDSIEKALYGDGQSLGFIDIADQYGSTKAGNLANYYAGRSLMNKGEYDAALDHLKKTSFSDYFFAASTVILQGDCHSELGDYSKAADLYEKAANLRENQVTGPKALYKAAIAHEAAGEFDDAIDVLEALRKTYNKSMEASGVAQYISKLTEKQAAQ